MKKTIQEKTRDYVVRKKLELVFWALRKAGYNVKPGYFKDSIILEIVPFDYANNNKRRNKSRRG